MKIVHIHSYYMDGWGYQENHLPKYQQDFGHEVVMITSDRSRYLMPRTDSRTIGIGEFNDRGLRVLRLRSACEFKSRFVRLLKLYETLLHERPDYLFVHEGLTSPSLSIAVKYKREHPSVFLAVDNHADYHNSGRNIIWRLLYYRTFWRNMVNYAKNYVDIFFSVTQGCKSFAENELGVPSGRHQVLYLGADVNHDYFRQEWRGEIRRALNLSNENVVFVTAGKIDRRKNTHKLIHALRMINSDNLRLMIVGSIDQAYECELDHLIGSDRRILKVGWVDAEKMRKYFSAADIAIFPGGQSVLWQQAISCELPAIFMYRPDSEYLLSRENGLFLFSDSPLETKQAMCTLAFSNEMINVMRENARRERDEILSYRLIAEQSINVIKQTQAE